MRVALINNGTKYLDALQALLSRHDVALFDYSEVVSIPAVDLIVLSGGSQFPILEHEGKLDDEIHLIRTTEVPLIGICYGCELIAHALGGELYLLPGGKVSGNERIEITMSDPLFDGHTELEVFESHQWAIHSIPEELEILAQSEFGPEVFRHRTRALWGFQYHPEKTHPKSPAVQVFNRVVSSFEKAS